MVSAAEACNLGGPIRGAIRQRSPHEHQVHDLPFLLVLMVRIVIGLVEQRWRDNRRR
jgi:hypothetical protein